MTQRWVGMWRKVRQRLGSQPPSLLTAWAVPAWAGFAVGLVELSAARPQLPVGASAMLLGISALAFGMLLGLGVALPLGLVRAGLAGLVSTREARRDPYTIPALLLGAACFVGIAFPLIRWLLGAGLQARALGAWLATGSLAVAVLLGAGVRAVVGDLLRRLGSGWAVRGAAWAVAGFAWFALARLVILHLQPVGGALPSKLLLRAGLLLGGAMVGVYADRWLWRPARWPVVAAALGVVAVSLPWAVAGLARAPTTLPVLIGHTELVGAVPRALRSVSDGDGDGYASWLGGGDCDDGDAAVHPGALEVLGNDADEDCDGVALQHDPTEGTLSGRLAGASCQSELALPQGTHVVLLVADAVRADRVGAASGREVMPELGALATDAVWFSRCYTPHPSTAYALPALFTGLQTRWARDLMASQYADIPKDRSLIQTELVRRSYLAAGIYGHFLAGHRHAMTRGMTETRLRREAVSSQRVADDAIGFMDEAVALGRPLFLYAHFYDPHWEYARYGPDVAPWGNERHVDRYDGEVRNVDIGIGRIVDALRERQLWDHTLLVVVADHGQEFGEHGGRFHGQSMYEEVVRVPCLIRVPGMAPRTVRQPVSLVDIYPTVLDLLGIDARPPVQGVSLEPLMQGLPCRRGPIVGEMQPWTKRPPFKPWLWYLVEGDQKIIYDVKGHSYELYDLDADPGEQRNLVEVEPSEFERLRRRLHDEVAARIALPVGSHAAEVLRFGPLPPGTPR